MIPRVTPWGEVVLGPLSAKWVWTDWLGISLLVVVAVFAIIALRASRRGSPEAAHA